MTDAPDITQAPDATRTLQLSRRFAVPVERLYAAWTDPEQACQWLGPKNVSCRIDLWDFREGGDYAVVLLSPENKEHGARGVFGTIDPPNRLTMSWTWQHEGQMQGVETILDLKFAATPDGASELQLTHSMLPNDEMAEGHSDGWQGALDCLAAYLGE
ncbi:MAG: SRPBCC domain-containing protein [Alphaproteobacteria bacterium]